MMKFPQLPKNTIVKTFHLKNGGIKIYWKEPTENIISRFICTLLLGFGLGGWLTHGYSSFLSMFSVFTNMIFPDTWWRWVLLPISLIMLLFILCFCLLFSFIWIFGTLYISMYIFRLLVGTGYSKITLLNNSIQYEAKREKLFNDRKQQITKKEH